MPSAEKTPSLSSLATSFPVRIRSFTGLHNSNNSQRIGLAVQSVVTAWKKFAASPGFQCIEYLFLSYKLLDTGSNQFRVIATKAEGYAPVSTATTISESTEPTLNPLLTFSGVTSRPTHVDTILRSLVKQFFADLDQVLLSGDLYLASEHSQILILKSVSSCTCQVPPKYNTLIGADSCPLSHFMIAVQNCHVAH